MNEKELLQRAKEEIKSLRAVVERQSIRLDAIDDMLVMVFAKPGSKSSGGTMSPDIVFEIETAIKKSQDV